MDDYELGPEIDHNDSVGLKTFEARNTRLNMDVYVLEFTTSDIGFLDKIIKDAFRRSTVQIAEDGVLQAVILTGKITQKFKINYIIERLETKVDSFKISRVDYEQELPEGLAAITLGRKLAENTGTKMTVYEGVVKETREPVVVKVLQMWHVDTLNAAIREVIMQAHAQHRLIARLINVAISKTQGKSGVDFVFIMERLERDLMKDMEKRTEPYPEEELMVCFVQVSGALLHAKVRVTLTQGLAHRDLKPHNIFISENGDYKVGDFGVSTETEEGTLAVDAQGTLQYMSPETKESMASDDMQVDPYKADVYSLGVTMLHMALLQYPEELLSTDKEELVAAIEQNINKLAYSDRVKSLLRSMLSVDIETRPYLEGVRAALVGPTDQDKWFDFGQTLSDEATGYEERECLTEIESLKRQGKADPAFVGRQYRCLGDVYMRQVRLQEAEEVLLKSARILEPLRDPVLTEVYSDLSTVYRNLNRLEDAAEAINKTIQMEIEYGGTTTLPMNYNKLARIYYLQGLLYDAEEAANTSVTYIKGWYGDEFPMLIHPYETLSLIYQSRGEPKEAERFVDKIIFITAETYGTKHIKYAESYNTLASLYIAQGRLEYAERAALKSVKKIIKIEGDEYVSLVNSYKTLASVYIAQSRLPEAEEVALKSIAIATKNCGAKHSSLPPLYSNLSKVYRVQGRTQEEEQSTLKELAITVKNHGDAHASLADIYFHLAEIYRSQGRMSEAEKTILKSIAIRIQSKGKRHISLLPGYLCLAYVHYHQDQLPQAQEVVSLAVSIAEGNPSPELDDILALQGLILAAKAAA